MRLAEYAKRIGMGRGRRRGRLPGRRRFVTSTRRLPRNAYSSVVRKEGSLLNAGVLSRRCSRPRQGTGSGRRPEPLCRGHLILEAPSATSAVILRFRLRSDPLPARQMLPPCSDRSFWCITVSDTSRCPGDLVGVVLAHGVLVPQTHEAAVGVG